jgi:hypothetical protein
MMSIWAPTTDARILEIVDSMTNAPQEKAGQLKTRMSIHANKLFKQQSSGHISPRTSIGDIGSDDSSEEKSAAGVTPVRKGGRDSTNSSQGLMANRV